MKNQHTTIFLALALCLAVNPANAFSSSRVMPAELSATDRLLSLQNVCSRIAHGGTPLRGDTTHEYLLSKICDDMGTQVIKAENQTKDATTINAFDKLYERCIDESKSDGAMFDYRGHHRYGYYLSAKSVCNDYRDAFNETTMN